MYHEAAICTQLKQTWHLMAFLQNFLGRYEERHLVHHVELSALAVPRFKFQIEVEPEVPFEHELNSSTWLEKKSEKPSNSVKSTTLEVLLY